MVVAIPSNDSKILKVVINTKHNICLIFTVIITIPSIRYAWKSKISLISRSQNSTKITKAWSKFSCQDKISPKLENRQSMTKI